VRVAYGSTAAATAAVRRFGPVRKLAIFSSRALASLVRVTLRLILPKPRFLRLFARFTPRRLVRPPFRGVKLLLSGRKHKIFRAVSAGQRLVFKRVHDFTADDLLVRLLVHFEAVVVVVVFFLFLLLGVFFFSLVWFSDGCETRTDVVLLVFLEKKNGSEKAALGEKGGGGANEKRIRASSRSFSPFCSNRIEKRNARKK